jgi:RimK family alpha-L-glutamate ligase
MKIGVLAHRQEEWHVERLLEELRRRGVEAYAFPSTRFFSRIGFKPKVSVRGYSIDEYEAIIVRQVPGGSPEQVFYRMDVLHRLEDLGIYVMNPAEGIERAVDKYYTSTLLEDAAIPTPRTAVTESYREAMDAFEELGGDVVVKPLFGSLGVGMLRVSDRDMAHRVFRAIELIRGVYYLQEYIPHRNQDIRAFVVGDRVVASMMRIGADWRTNISRGGRGEPLNLDEDLKKLSVKATRVIGLDYAGVDILPSQDGKHYITEVNSTPGWRGLQGVTDVNIAAVIVEHLLSKLG